MLLWSYRSVMSAMCCQAANAVKEVSIMGDDHHGMGILL